MIRYSLVLLLAATMLGGTEVGGTEVPPPASHPATQPVATVTIEVKDVRNAKGQLIFGVFKSAAGFPSEERKSVFWEVRPAKPPHKGETITFTATLPPGTYAASVLHDENNSGDMDKGLGGVPKEGYGVTNNPKPRFRAARYDEATFELTPAGVKKTISVQYF
jgi:uncharacterized protein (DUF2141 family)